MKKMSLIAIIAAISFVLNSCSSVPTGVTGGYYTSADCQGKPEAIYNSANAIDKIVVSKSEHKMYLYKNGNVVNTFPVSLGKNDHLGNKVQRGDKKTPVGSYRILNKRCHPIKYRAMTISYPNAKDRRRAADIGVDPGSLITIHGQPHWNADGHGDSYTLSNDWTDGCIALTNSDLDILWGKIRVGTTIVINE